VQARAAVAEQRKPGPGLVAGDIAQHLAHERRVVQVVVVLNQLVPAPGLIRPDQFQVHRVEQVLLCSRGKGAVAHRRSIKPGAKHLVSLLIHIIPAKFLPLTDESALSMHLPVPIFLTIFLLCCL